MLQAYIMIGAPGSGKSTWIKNHLQNNVIIISRDNIVMELANTSDYQKAWNSVDQKQVDKILQERFDNINGVGNFAIDMTNMSKKSRKRWINKIDKSLYEIEAIVFELPKEVLIERNKLRQAENKNMPLMVIDQMLNNYEKPSHDEGFNGIYYIREEQ